MDEACISNNIRNYDINRYLLGQIIQDTEVLQIFFYCLLINSLIYTTTCVPLEATYLVTSGGIYEDTHMQRIRAALKFRD
jgi:hypothetical protein